MSKLSFIGFVILFLAGTVSSYGQTVDNFDEKTVRTKKFTGQQWPIGESFELVVTPAATNIEGTFEAVVIVSGGIFCKAAATMTVVNP